MSRNDPTVYSTESSRMCAKCGKPTAACICKKTSLTRLKSGAVKVARESKGRKGKTVTLISNLPLGEEALRTLLSDLKRLCGTGGTLKDGGLEVQGDHRETICNELNKRGFSAKKVGG
jgi:translation initiation factor 1